MVQEQAQPHRGAPAASTLSRSPLALVLAQLQFPAQLTALTSTSEPNPPLDKAMNEAGFPAVQPLQDTAIQLTPTGPVQTQHTWRRLYRDLRDGLYLSVTGQFIAFYAVRTNGRIAYDHHDAFISRLSDIVASLAPIINEAPVARAGYRYVDQFFGKDLADIDQLLAPAYRGVAASNTVAGATLDSSVLRAQFSYPDTSDVSSPPSELLQVQSGLLPPQQTADPAIAPSANSSWILDIDAYSIRPFEFTSKGVTNTSRRLQARARNFLDTSAVTHEFYERFK